MKRHLFLLTENIYILLALTTLLFVFLNIGTFIEYLQINLLSGGDAASYISAGQYYSEHIFPSVWGWIPNWFAGMPFPQFYPPLIFIITALLSKILFFFSYITVFKLFTLFFQIITPALIVWFTYKTTRNILSAWIASMFAIVFISHDALFERFDGITIASTLNAGFIAQLVGFIFLLIWFRYFTKTKQTLQTKIISILSLFFVFISNVHIVPIAGIYFLVAYAATIFKYIHPTKIYSIILKTGEFLIQGIVPILLAAFWYLPLYVHKDYLVTMTLSTPDQLFKKSIYIIIFIFISLFISLRKKQGQILILSISNCILFILLFIDIQKYIPNLPIQPDRWLATIFFIGLIHVAHVLGETILYINKKTKKDFTLPLLILCVLILLPIAYKSYTFDQNLNFQEDPNFEKISEYLKDKKGRIHIENYFTDNTFTSFAYDAYLGLQTEGSNTLSLRESSISSLFMIPLRNSLSQNLEIYGIKSYKALDKSLYSEDWNKNIERAVYGGTKYFLFSSSVKKYKTIQESPLVLEKEYSNWSIFSTPKDVAFVETQKYKPVLLFSEINFKNRGANEYNYARIQEEFFFGKPRDFVLVNAHNLKLDSTKDLDLFDTTVVATYNYDDIDIAYQKLYEYSKTKNLVLIFDTDPLFNKLSILASNGHNIKIIQKNTNTNADISIFQKNIETLFDYLESIKKQNPNKSQMAQGEINKKNITISVENSETLNPILIKETFFPAWKNSNGQPTYLASPSFMLTFATSSFELNFETSRSVYWGWFISLATLVVLGTYIYSNRVKK